VTAIQLSENRISEWSHGLLTKAADSNTRLGRNWTRPEQCLQRGGYGGGYLFVCGPQCTSVSVTHTLHTDTNHRPRGWSIASTIIIAGL